MKNVKHALVFARDYILFLYYVAKSRGYTEWVDQSDGSVMRDRWGYRQMMRILRPRFYGFLKRRECGCSFRFGRKVYTLYGCVLHCPLTRRRSA